MDEQLQLIGHKNDNIFVDPNFSILDLIDILKIFFPFQGRNIEDQVTTILILSLTAIFLLTVSTILLILCWKRIRVSGFLFLPVLVKID